MFRSLFARLLVTMAMVLTVSFLILSLILASFASEYEVERRSEDLLRTAHAAEQLLSDGLGVGTAEDLEAFIGRAPERYSTLFRVFLSNTEETVLLLCDTEGKVLLSEDGTQEPKSYIGTYMAPSLVSSVLDGAEYSGTLPLFKGEAPRLVGAMLLSGRDGRTVGFLVTFSTVENYGGMTQTLIRTVLVTSLWIILAALVVLYLFCERVAGPLREMGVVTKRFAAGRFERRVKVVGNDEVAMLGRAFNQMADSLEQLETMRNSFISNVSHDLRTPMTTILGFIEGITSGAIPEEKREYYLGVIAEEVRRLSRLVTQLLDLSRLQSGTRKFHYENFDVCEMARLILIANEQRIDARKLDVSFEAHSDNILVRSDKDAVHQVLYNLCDNAIKFAREGARLAISILPAGRRKVAITVFNEGEGIPEGDIPFVFDRFYKSDKSRGRDKSGAGLGLYICKTIVDAIGEELTLKSEPGNSCSFTLTLPVAGD